MPKKGMFIFFQTIPTYSLGYILALVPVERQYNLILPCIQMSKMQSDDDTLNEAHLAKHARSIMVGVTL
jgi:hypothetical protein